MHIDAIETARQYGRGQVGNYGYAALTAHSTTGARESMIRLARDILGIENDPPNETVDALADAYWEGVGER